MNNDKMDLETENVLNAICAAITANCPKGLYSECPVIQMVVDARDRICEHNSRITARKLKIELSPVGCPCQGRPKPQGQ